MTHWTVQQIAAAHQFTPAAIIAMIRRGEIRARKVGTEYRIGDADYRTWLSDTEVRP
jgi:excisionase family DNA binding protein